MASSDNNIEEQRIDTSKLSLAEIRALAQIHIQEIGLSATEEAQRQLTAEHEVQKYLQPSRRGKAANKSSSASTTVNHDHESTTKGPKLRSAPDVLHRLRWDPSVKLEDYTVGYLERFEGIKEMPVAKWIKESTHEDFIPQHRIKYVKRRGEHGDEIVWDRDGKVDKIFGSGFQDMLDDAGSDAGVKLA